ALVLPGRPAWRGGGRVLAVARHARIPILPAVAGVPGCRRVGGLRHPHGRRLHQRSWRMRAGAFVIALSGGRAHLHGHGRDHGSRRSPCTGSPRMKYLVSLIAGGLFGFGLALAQMTNPAKILNFLDFTGTWDPTLAFVLGGALL